MLDSPRLSRSPKIAQNAGQHLSVVVGPSKGRRSGLRSRGTQLLFLRFGWVVLVIWYEVGEFFSSLSSCRFPDAQLLRMPGSESPTHVVLLADPHVPHPKLSYPPESRPWINFLRQGMDELFMRKSWNVVMRLGRVDVVLVLGDMLDWGRGVMSEQEYDDYVALFRSIFRLPPSVPMFYVPGNHDLPLGPNRLFSPHARDRYARHFSPPNAILPIANHSLILLDAVGLVEEDYRRYAAEMQFGEWDGVEGGVIEFVKALGEEDHLGPTILISHIPLARPEAHSCGPLRERGRILKGAGPGYQNLLGSETSRFLLDQIKPSVVFSGDDHDYCEYTHQRGIREVTVKSFSSSMGIRRPGFQLLSLIPPPTTQFSELTKPVTHADRPCFLPDQLGVYNRVYLPLALATILYLLITNIRTAWHMSNGLGLSHLYGDLKSRFSPNLQSSEQMPQAAVTGRRLSDRPVPLTLPSRKSSQQLSANAQMQPRSARLPSFGMSLDTPTSRHSSRSAPVSPTLTPRVSFDEKTASAWGNSNGVITEDEESHYAPSTNGGNDSPSLSRRSSYIYMHSGKDHNAPLTAEPNSYFLPLPGQERQIGLGLSSPSLGPGFAAQQSTHSIRRVSSAISMTPTSSNGSYLPPQGFQGYHQPGGLGISNGGPSGIPLPPANPRRVTMPRMLSTSDWSAAAKAKDKTVLGLMVDSIPLPGQGPGPKRGGVMRLVRGMWGFAGWLWRARNGVVGKSWRETWAVAWPAGVVWVLVNALFFVS